MTVRHISVDGLRELFAQNSGHALLVLLTITHPALSMPIRLVNDRRPLVYDGQTYTGLPFELALPEDTEDQIPYVELRVDNVGRVLTELVRSVLDPATVTIDAVRVAPDGSATLELGPLEFSILDSRITDIEVTLQLGYLVDVLNEPATGEIFNPSTAPGLYR